MNERAKSLVNERAKSPVKGTEKSPAKHYYRKRVELLRLIEKIKLWPSRTGVLHGIRSIDRHGESARISTHCNRIFTVTNSRNSRAARWLRNKMFFKVCPECRIPEWKLEKYNSSRFNRHHGSQLAATQSVQKD